MRTETRIAFNRYVERIAELNGVSDATVKFTTAPTIQQTLETKMQEGSDFLKLINMFPVQEMEGQKVGMSATSPIASNTNTAQANNPRVTTDPIGLSDKGYRCEKNNSDWHMKYARLDMWAKFPDFQTRIRDNILKQQGRDRMMIGFNGTSYAPNSDKVANPLLQDVNIGWLKKMELERPAGVMSDGPSTGANAVKIGAAGADYRNLDALVYDAVAEMIEPWYREDTSLVAIIGRSLLHDKYFPIVNGAASDAPTEQLARDVILATKRVGGLTAMAVPFFPANAIMITSLDNLSIYYQEGARRRMIKDNPEFDRIDNFESSNDSYVIEDVGKAALVKNIVLV